jgi:hypothetical protein
MDVPDLYGLITKTMTNIALKGAILHAYRPLLVPDTDFLTNQWQVTYDVTDCGYKKRN